jgi:hypothetical protein
MGKIQGPDKERNVRDVLLECVASAVGADDEIPPPLNFWSVRHITPVAPKGIDRHQHITRE